MKEIKAIIRLEKSGVVLDVLEKEGYVNATLTHALAVGANIDEEKGKMNLEFGRKVTKMVKLEIVCLDRDADVLVDLISNAVCTGRKGDGIIRVANVNRLRKIRNKKESLEAL